jgi:spermidine synthase
LPLGFALVLALASAGALHEVCGVQPAALASAGALHEVCGVQPAAYLVTGMGPPRSVPLVIGLASTALGAVAIRKKRRPEALLPWFAALSALIVGASAPLLFAAFGNRGPVAEIALLVPALAGFAIGATLFAAWRALGKMLIALGAGAYLVSPFRLLIVALIAVGSSAAASTVGNLRSALAPAMILAALGIAWPPLYAYLERRPLPRARSARRFSFVVWLACSAAFVASEHWVPIREIRQYANPIVFRQRTERQVFVVTSGQDTFELHIDGRLKLSGVDEVRYFEALVQPALAVAERSRRVLLLGGGTGLSEREILRHDSVESITVVTPDKSLIELSRRLSWLARRAGDALDSPKIAIVEAEPIVWLGETTDRFDLAIVDLPDPDSYISAKSYTRHFYRLLADRIGPSGVIGLQAASPFGSTQSFASIEATLQAAGLSTLPYHAAVPTFGDWGFLLAARDAPPDRAKLAKATPFLSGVTISELGYLPRDLRSSAPGEVSTLHHQRILDLFQQERGGS